ncbi:unnamed protein product [Meloidogyne enterolobii]|uniref:Uncharacterized protein n=1 Tax=Meloidogyne enterolobii TaxID=390850 RepID=A0ACB0YC92_MELEN
MKLASFLIVLIINGIIWSPVKTTSTQKGLAAENNYSATKILNDGAESSVNPQIQKYKETLKPKVKISKKDKDRGGDNESNKSKYNKEYYQKNKERFLQHMRNYNKKNKEKKNQFSKIYYQKNKETVQKRKRIYYQNNKEKLKEYQQKYQQKKKIVKLADDEGTSFVNPQTGDFINKGKLPIVCEEKRNLLNQGAEECNNGEDGQNQIEVEEPNKIFDDATIDLNKKILPFDLNEEEGNLFNQPEDEQNNGEVNQIEVEEPNKIPGDDINQINLNKKILPFDLNEMPEDEVLEDH